jgi:hypothetical protein
LIEEGVVAFVRGPDGHVVAPGDSALGGLPEEFGVGVFGEFVEADVAAVNGHGLGVSGEGDDARPGVEFYVAHFEFLRDGVTCTGHVDFEVIFAVGNDGLCEVEESDKFPSSVHVFERARIIFGGKEVIAVVKVESLSDVFESVCEGPADADRFFCECKDLLLSRMEGVFGEDPRNLVRQEVGVKDGFGIDVDGRIYSAHSGFLNFEFGFLIGK